jgi:Ca-activated chloride channel homolog
MRARDAMQSLHFCVRNWGSYKLNQKRSREAQSWWLILRLIGLASLVVPSPTVAQSIDEVHIVSRNFPVSNPSTTPAQVSSQPDAARDTNPARSLRVDVDLVLVPATVTDRMNRPIIDLQQQDFGVFEDDARQQIRYFSEEDEPISIGLILDVSKSMSNKVDTERAAVAQFFKNANPQDDYFVISLANRPQVIADNTQSLDEIQQKLALVIPKGNTALLDAIYLGAAKMRSARYPRRALLIISDGGDNHSHYTTRETRNLVQESDVLAYSIGIFDSLPVPGFKTVEEKLGRRLLSEITEASGGRTIAAEKAERVPEIAATISRELRQQYVLGYKSNNALRDGKWRKIKVQVTAETGDPPLRAYYKRGYVAPEK